MNTDDIAGNAPTWQDETRQSSQKLKESAQQTARDLQQTARDLQAAAQVWQRKAAEATRRAAAATDAYVRENPWIAVGCVAASCFLLGLLVGRSGGSSRED
jgi:ElaB/YqjD/DUF883 family membrane-anchored ribosome-binding protein